MTAATRPVRADRGPDTGRIGRRRFLAISACGAALAGRRAGAAATASWRGRALGAEASITLGGTGRRRAEETFAAVTTEIDRLEDIFSLYRDGSALARLNRDGRLGAPPAELVEVLALCDALHAATGGAFDPTVQPLWRALATGAGPRPARALAGWDGVRAGPERIALARPGMALTLTGVAQGYITDRIAALMRGHGWRDVLVDAGEIAALGQNHGAPWQAGVAAPGGAVLRRLRLSDRCLAVSSTNGTLLPDGTGHILDPRPRGGGAPDPGRTVAVSAGAAALADGLSTGCALLPPAAAAAAVARFPGARLELLT